MFEANIVRRESMSLYSSETLSNAAEGESDNGSNDFEPEKEMCPKGRKEELSWCYCFVYYAQLKLVEEKLNETFRTYIHRSIRYQREKHGVSKTEKPTIPGLIFIQGKSAEIETYLKHNIPGVYLSKDCMTHQPAVVSDRAMQAFMQIAELDPSRIRFMPHSFDYYSSGHALVKVTSGVLAGMEGYQVRISRNKCFITTLGGVTLAISGLTKETFENVGDYVQSRRLSQYIEDKVEKQGTVSYEEEVSSCFFFPKNQLDLFAVTRSLDFWLVKAGRLYRSGHLNDAVEIILPILENTGKTFYHIYGQPAIGDFRFLTALCTAADRILQEIAVRPECDSVLKEKILSARQHLKNSYPFLPFKK